MDTKSSAGSGVNDIIDASPTKEFFISMLIKDIGLIRSIIDLVDNSLDGARRLRDDGSFTGLHIDIMANGKSFTISDNCGGIPLEIAKNYAFRFGRPDGMQAVPHSVGQFGVGMKRALFKLGKIFTIKSTTDISQFVVKIDVDEWKKDENNWQFKFSQVSKREPHSPFEEKDRGTIIEVTSLHEAVSESFSLENFQKRLLLEIEEAHRCSIENGIAISLNHNELHARTLKVFVSDQLIPASMKLEFKEPNRDSVTVGIYAGIAEADPSEAGWYIFCNDRLVLGADQTVVTGWGENAERTVPKYHNTYARFRGFVFFDSNDASLLPWNTTKTGIDGDSPRYRGVRQEMIRIMLPVIDFLRKLDNERSQKKDGLIEEAPLDSAVQTAALRRLSDVPAQQIFIAPKPIPRPSLPRVGRIQYSKPLEAIQKVKSCLRVTSLKAVGEKTFDYYYKMECEE